MVPGRTDTIVLADSDIPAIPATVTPIPACATALPHTESGCAPARAHAADSGTRNSLMRSISSANAPAISQAEAANPAAAKACRNPASAATPTSAAKAAAHHSRTSAGSKSARFHGSTGPTLMAANNGTSSGTTVRWK